MKPTASWWKIALQRGLIGGLVIVTISLIGMVMTFNVRELIGGVLPMGLAFIFITVYITAYSAAQATKSHAPLQLLIAGLISGAVSGVVLSLVVVFLSNVNLRSMFINASPELFAVLTFHKSLALGALLIVLVDGGFGLLAGATALLPAVGQRITTRTIAYLFLIGLLADLVRIIISQWSFIAIALDWMFVQGGLSLMGAIVVIVLLVASQIYQSRQPVKARQTFSLRPRTVKGWVRLGLLVVVLLSIPILGQYVSEVFDQVGLFILMGLGLNIVVGYAGLLDLGYVAFYAIGAYTIGVLTSPELGYASMSFWTALPIAVVVSTLAGVLLGIPVLKMRGDYLAIVTLGFGEIIRILALSDMLKPYIGGSQGIQLIAKPQIGSFVFSDQRSIYYIILAGALLAAFIATRLRDSRMGRTWMALREDEDVAQAQGINLVATKLLAFATGAAFSGLSGAIFASKLASAYPHSFKLMVSINVLALIIVGGMGSIPGVIVGAFALVGLPELLREFAEFRELAYGAVLVVMMLYRPEGLIPVEARKHELHAEEELTAETPAAVETQA